MEVVGAACGLVPCLWPPLKEQINYVKNLKKNFTKLEEDVEALCNLKNDIGREIARDTSKILSEECKGWTEKVDKVVTEVNEIKEEIDENRRCLNRCCFPDICARRKAGKRVVTMLEEVAELNKADFKGAKYVDAPAAVVEEIPVPDIKGGETAVERTVQRIRQSIMDANIKKIGLWGMGGVGKTTALKYLNNHSEIAQTFEVVIWVTVSKEGSVRKVQKDIAQRLQMEIQESEADERNASKLHGELKKKYLLLLDDLWSPSPVNLEEVGIPIQEGSKVVLTTRSLNVCRNMETDEEIKVECLSEEEAWDLFREKAGGVVDYPSIEPIAKDVAKECAGLPLAVVVTGKSLRKVENVHVWRNALNHLQKATVQVGNPEDGMFERLKLSYERLKDDEQSCFLYCALYPEDHKIRVVELVELWRAEGFLDSDGMDSLDDAVAGGHTKVENLVDASLLERTGDCVKMHDVLRDLALRIASSKFLVRAGLGIEECPYDEKEWEEARRISLMYNKLSGGLPTNPRCNELSTLLLNGNLSLESIPDMFFQHMPRLQVLDLTWTRIKVVPASVSNLVNLRGLYPSSWGGPVDLPREIGALKKLEVLEVIVGSFPIEVRQLTSLRRLWVKFHTEESMKTICSNDVISSLFQLEDLRIYFRDDFEDNLRREWCKVVDDSRVGEEVGRLKRLTRLEFDFSRIECLEHFLAQRNTNSCPELKDFHLSMTNGSFFPSAGIRRFGEEMKKTLMWNEGERELSSEVKMSQIINQALRFQLTSHKTATSLLHLGMENIQRLEEWEVKECPAMETIVESYGPSTSTTNVTPVLLNLKELRLSKLPNLKSICEDPRHRFTKLTTLVIYECPKLSSCVFTQGMIQHMPNLEELSVQGCEGIEEIVMREDVEETNHPHLQLIFFPKLRELELRRCPNLVRIWKGVSQPWPSIQEIEVRYCPNLENLNLNAVDDQNPLAALRKIKGENEWWEALKWEDENSKHRLQPFFQPW